MSSLMSILQKIWSSETVESVVLIFKIYEGVLNLELPHALVPIKYLVTIR